MKYSIVAIALLGAALVARPHAAAPVAAETDLDAFMQQVLARRDDNWKKLQQYILDEREQVEVRGPAHINLWGEERDFTWYVRDGYFVRSPLKVNGVAISEADRRKYEADYLRRVKRRDQRGVDRSTAAPPETVIPRETPSDVTGLIQQSRQPEFISSAYFLRFKFDAGTYALVGRERFEDRDVLRIEYYPTKLFSDSREGRQGRGGQEGREGQQGRGRRDAQDRDRNDDGIDAAMRRLMNKVALITLWIEPVSHQIVKYTYDNVALDFLPAQWLIHVDDVRASMTMGQPFPDVWLPRALNLDAALTLALGRVEFRMGLNYHDYRQADATVKVR